MKPGDLVQVDRVALPSFVTENRSDLAVIIKPHYSSVGVEYVLKPLDSGGQIVCSPCDFKIISASK